MKLFVLLVVILLSDPISCQNGKYSTIKLQYNDGHPELIFADANATDDSFFRLYELILQMPETNYWDDEYWEDEDDSSSDPPTAAADSPPSAEQKEEP